MTSLPQMAMFKQLNDALDVYCLDVTSELTTDGSLLENSKHLKV